MLSFRTSLRRCHQAVHLAVTRLGQAGGWNNTQHWQLALPPSQSYRCISYTAARSSVWCGCIRGVLFVGVPRQKPWGSPSVEWKGSAVQPVLLCILLYMYAVPVWQLLSESGFGNFNNRACYFIDSFRVFKWCVHLYLYIHTKIVCAGALKFCSAKRCAPYINYPLLLSLLSVTCCCCSVKSKNRLWFFFPICFPFQFCFPKMSS